MGRSCLLVYRGLMLWCTERGCKGRGREAQVCLWLSGTYLIDPAVPQYSVPAYLRTCLGTQSLIVTVPTPSVLPGTGPPATAAEAPITARYNECKPLYQITWLGLRAGRHLSSHIMSPHRACETKQSKAQESGVSHSKPLPPAYRPAPHRPLHYRRPSDRLPKQRAMKLHCRWSRRAGYLSMSVAGTR